MISSPPSFEPKPPLGAGSQPSADEPPSLAGWTRVQDDSFQTLRLTGFEILYIQGDIKLAAAATQSLLRLQGCFISPHDEAAPFRFENPKNFAKASRRERGRHRAKADIPSDKPLGALAWMNLCERAIERAPSGGAQGAPMMFLCPKTEALCLALSSELIFGRGLDKGAWDLELFEAVRAGPAPRRANWPFVARTLAGVLEQAAYFRQDILGDQLGPGQSWAWAAASARGGDFNAARQWAEGDPALLKRIDHAQLIFGVFEHPYSLEDDTIDVDALFLNLDSASAERMLDIARADTQLGQALLSHPATLAALESLALRALAQPEPRAKLGRL